MTRRNVAIIRKAIEEAKVWLDDSLSDGVYRALVKAERALKRTERAIK